MSVSTHEVYWAAGFLEGEGCFTLQGPSKKTPLVTASQVEREPLDRLIRIFGGRMYVQNHNKVEGGIFNHWYLNGSMSVQAMMTLYNLMSAKRKGQIERVLEVWKDTLSVRGRDSRYCVNGHLMEGDNVRYVDRSKSGRRSYKECRICRNSYQRAHRNGSAEPRRIQQDYSAADFSDL